MQEITVQDILAFKLSHPAVLLPDTFHAGQEKCFLLLLRALFSHLLLVHFRAGAPDLAKVFLCALWVSPDTVSPQLQSQNYRDHGASAGNCTESSDAKAAVFSLKQAMSVVTLSVSSQPHLNSIW